MSATERPVKRARQACLPCRRKKSRCPGEKPICSCCARLGQQCTYDDEIVPRSQSVGGELSLLSTPPRSTPIRLSEDQRHLNGGVDTTRRLNSLEAKLAEVLDALHNNAQNPRTHSHSPAPRLQQPIETPTVKSSVLPSHSAPPSIEHASVVADLYLKYCHCQPLPLFVPAEFSRRLPTYEDEIFYVVSALALRFSAETVSDMELKSYVDKARALTMQRVIDGPIELSTLQSLCLLSWIDFYNGNTQRASMYSSLASDISKSSNLVGQVASDPYLYEEKLRCFWTIALLQLLHSNNSGPLHLVFDKGDALPAHPKSSPRPPLRDMQNQNMSDFRTSDSEDYGIIACAIELAEVWHRVSRYAHRRASAGPHPPWSSKSEYAKIMAHQTDLEANLPYGRHRFKLARFGARDAAELFEHRDYWGPWLFTQMVYHTVICTLNHPLLLSLRLRHFRVAAIPEIWLQHTDDLISQHSHWVVHIIDLVEDKGFTVSDPFLAHCVALVATIFLQQSFTDDTRVQQIKRENFVKCLRFCEKIGNIWPYIKEVARKLQKFERVVSDSYLNSAASSPDDKVFVDLSLFWEILESAALGEKPDFNGLSVGATLKPRVPSSMVAEEVNAQLLPEPSRVVVVGNAANGTDAQIALDATSGVSFPVNAQANTLNDDLNVLAQSYFAQGQDFVGNMDDWWMLDDSAQTV